MALFYRAPLTDDGGVRILLKLILNCEPDAAWNAIRSPEVFRAVSYPLTSFTSLEPAGFPESWPAGEHPVLAKAFGIVPIGKQTIDIAFPTRADGIRAVVDTGHGLSGPLTLVTKWEHTMTVAPAPGKRTLYRDQLIFEAGTLTPLLWPVYWAFWQWRALALLRLAPGFH